MIKETNKTELFIKYFERWIKVYKDGAIRPVTMKKYILRDSKESNDSFELHTNKCIIVLQSPKNKRKERCK